MPAWCRAALAAAAVTALCALPAVAARKPKAPKPAAAPAPAAPLSRDLAVAPEPLDPGTLALRRAAAAHDRRDPLGVIEALEPLDWSSAPAFAGADRAAYLLAHAYLSLGALERFEHLAAAVAAWPGPSPFTRWLELRRLMVTAATPGALDSLRAIPGDAVARAPGDGLAPALDALAADAALRAGDPGAALRRLERAGNAPLPSWLRAEALAAAGRDDTAELSALAAADTTTRDGRELAGAAILRLASRMLERGEDPRPLLAGTPAGSRHAARARHLAGLAAIERGDTASGRATLEALLADAPGYEARRDVRRALAGLALDRADWTGARDHYERAAGDRDRHREVLRERLEAGAFDSLWAAWRGGAAAPDALALDTEGLAAVARVVGTDAANLNGPLVPEPPSLSLAGPPAPDPWAVPPPGPGAWAALDSMTRERDDAAYQRDRHARELAAERARLDDLRRYLGIGGGRSRDEASELERRTRLLDSLKVTLDSLDARLRAVRDEATRRVLARAATMVARCGTHLAWSEAMRHFHLGGPHRERAVPAPDGYPEPDSVLAAEEALARLVLEAATRAAAETPDRIARSYAEAWRPGIIDRPGLQLGEAREALAWARRIGARIDSSAAATADSPEHRRLAAAVRALEARAAALDAAIASRRDAEARAALERALASLEDEREGLDYGLAASAYALAVRLDRGVAAADSAPAPGGDAGEAALDDSVTARWRAEAIARARAFLADHPRSEGRGEMRFRLADLLMVEARSAFRDAMARFVRPAAEGGGGALPLLDHGPALALYRTILREDSSFAHRDAVLFNAAMILADAGEPGAEPLFTELVARHPESAYVQESHLRLADMRFAEERWAEGVALYARAAEGPEPGLRAIALFKMGWAHYNQERFAEAADAFRAVLDLYAAEPRAARRADVAGEAESYLVHTLARAGGAPAFATLFDRTGPRPYEHRVLMALGQHFRRYSLYPEAAATDAMALARFPDDADALVSARRMVDTYARAERAADLRQARLDLAPRFAPGSRWHQAQGSDSVRAAGESFARESWLAVASQFHREAREKDAPESWRQARALYETLLERWPRHEEAAEFSLRAGESAFALGDHAGALGHYGRAAASGGDSVAVQALWQRVAVTDAWYESTRPAHGDSAAHGREALARDVLAASDALLERFPEHAGAADLRWRGGQLAFAHGWWERAAADLGGLATRHPSDRRAPEAAAQRADALLRLGRFDAAGEAWEQALATARTARNDTLVRRAEAAIPDAWMRHAEAEAKADPSAFASHAERFARVAARWPRYELAPTAQYRAGLMWGRAGRTREAVDALDSLAIRFPRSELVRDARLQVATLWKEANEPGRAAEAYVAFANAHPSDSTAKSAWLEAADLYAAAGDSARGERLRIEYLRRHPDDHATAMEILEPLAWRDLDSVGPARPLSSLLARPAAAPAKATARSRAKAAAGPAAPAPPPSHLADYLARAAAHPGLASPRLLGRVRFVEAEEAYARFDAARLGLPLKESLREKQRLLDSTLSAYRRSVDAGVPEWAHAATYRSGEALVAFGKALETSERPADLEGNDLLAYENVLAERSQGFYDRAEGVWADLLREAGRGEGDAWIARARESLWSRLGGRFYFRPEAEYPLVAAVAPETPEAPKEPRARSRAAKDTNDDGREPRGRNGRKGNTP